MYGQEDQEQRRAGSFDDAVEKGMIKASPLPKKKDGTVERTLVIAFKMKDMQ